MEHASTRAGEWKSKYEKAVKRNELVGRLMNNAEKMKNIKYATYLNATQFRTDVLKGNIEKLSRINFRGNLNKSGTR